MKRSQLYSQIFIYILTILLVSFILIYGYNAVQTFRDRAEQVSCLKFKNDLRNAISGILSDFGTVKNEDFELCGTYTQVCFVESFKRIDKNNLPFNVDPIIKDNILSGAGRNVFLVEKIAKDSFYAGNISVDQDVMCVNALNSKVSLRLEGKGNHVFLTRQN